MNNLDNFKLESVNICWLNRMKKEEICFKLITIKTSEQNKFKNFVSLFLFSKWIRLLNQFRKPKLKFKSV